MTTLDLAALRALCDAATPGPWEAGFYNKVISVPLSNEHMRIEREIDAMGEVPPESHPVWDSLPNTFVCFAPTIGGDTPTAQGLIDARFIAAAREALPALLDEVERLRAENERLRDFYDGVVP